MTGDAVRQLLAEVSERADAAPEWTGGPDWAFHALNDRAKLVAALTAVLDQHQPILYDKWALQTTDKAKAVVARCATCQRTVPIERGCNTYWAVAAALEEQP